ncbi:MAG: C40 family peptidase [Candidatus Eisenbacteria bacterium]
MSPVGQTHAVVTLPALDLRPRPAHQAELGSQLLLGEVVRILAGDRAGQWLRVRNQTDGYEGWVRDWGLAKCTAARARRWQATAHWLVLVPFGQARTEDGASLSPLFFGGRLIAGRKRDGRRPVELPDGRRGWVGEEVLRPLASRPPVIMARIRSLLGAPYLWGGRTPAGYDCSAFVQQVLFEQGTVVPRDAHEQWLACRPVPPERSPGIGDLAFFSVRPRGRMSHVGLALGGGWFAHARGTVRLDSLDVDNPMYLNDLAGQFRGWHRPLARRIPAAGDRRREP